MAILCMLFYDPQKVLWVNFLLLSLKIPNCHNYCSQAKFSGYRLYYHIPYRIESIVLSIIGE